MIFFKKENRISEDRMILAFLRSEIDSHRFRQKYEKHLNAFVRGNDLIEKANLEDAEESETRREILNKTRGFTSRKWLFKNFPLEVSWYKFPLTLEILKNLKYGNYKTWTKLSGGSRLASDGAKNIDLINPGEDLRIHIRGVFNALQEGKKFPELICAGKPGDQNFVLVEGHTRATAYLMPTQKVLQKVLKDSEIIIGISENMGDWWLY